MVPHLALLKKLIFSTVREVPGKHGLSRSSGEVPATRHNRLQALLRVESCLGARFLFHCWQAVLKGTELRWQIWESKTQIFAENRRCSQIHREFHPFCWKFWHLEDAGTAENCRFSQKAEENCAENCRKLQIGVRHLRSISPLARPSFCWQAGTTSPQTPDEWMKETGQGIVEASEEEMQCYVDMKTWLPTGGLQRGESSGRLSHVEFFKLG